MKNYLKIAMAHAVLAASVDVAGILRGFGVPGTESSGEVDPEKLKVRIGLDMVGVTGVLPIVPVLEGASIKFATPKMNAGVNRLHIELTYGTNAPSVLNVDLVVPQGADATPEAHDIDIKAVETLSADGGGADYKTDVYMDGAGRVMVERGKDGSTTVYDEHENPIAKRLADGTTQVFDAFQSVRVAIDNTNEGVVSVYGQMTQGNGAIVATGAGAHAEGYGCTASGVASHAEGTATVASGQGAHAEGSSSQTKTCEASGENSHAEGLGCVASGSNSHAEGYHTTARGAQSHAEGEAGLASGTNSHKEGDASNAVGTGSHAEGRENTAQGRGCHAEGWRTFANGYEAHTEGYFTRTEQNCSHAQGVYNNPEGGVYAFMHGCGTSDTDRRNAFLIAGDEVYVYGVGNYDGTNYGTEGVQSLRQVLSAINLKLVNVPTA